MATFTFFNQFFQDIGRKVHDLNSDTIMVALTNVAPNAGSNATLSDITQIEAGGGYTAGGFELANTGYALDGAVAELVAESLLIEADGEAMAQWRYAVYYNATADNDPLIGFVDNGSAIDLDTGESRTLAHDAGTGIARLGSGTIG